MRKTKASGWPPTPAAASKTQRSPIGNNEAIIRVFEQIRDSFDANIVFRTQPTWKNPPINENSSLGEQIRYYRRAANIKQTDLCKKLGCTRSTLNSLENDKLKVISIETLKAVLHELHIEDKVIVHDDYIRFLLSGSAKKIFTLRKSMNMTRTEFADWLGISFTAVKHWENGYNIISRGMYEKIKHRIDP